MNELKQRVFLAVNVLNERSTEDEQTEALDSDCSDADRKRNVADSQDAALNSYNQVSLCQF